MNKMRLVEFLSFVTIVLIIFFGIVLSNGRARIDLLYDGLNFVSFFVIIVTDTQYIINERIEKNIYTAAVLMLLGMVLTFFSPAAYVFEDGRNTGALVLGMTNPNLTGMMICAVFSIAAMAYKNNKRKIIWLVYMGVLLFFLYLTRARSSMLAAGFIVIFFVFFTKKKIPDWLILCIVLLPACVVPLYLSLYRMGVTNATIFGKLFFSGREITFLGALQSLSKWHHYIFGNYYLNHFSNAHNAALAVFCSIGAVGAISMYACFARKILWLNNKIESEEARMALICILGFFIQSSAEALVFTGYFTCTAFIYFFLIIASKDVANGQVKTVIT